MTRVLLLDVGGHMGETLDTALDPRYAIDEVHTFEPAAQCVEVLRKYREPRLHVHPFGLGADDDVRILYGAGSVGASLYADKPISRRGIQETVRLRDVAQWFELWVKEDDHVFMKLNCEGGEADVIKRLAEVDRLCRIESILLSPDVMKIPSMEHRAAELFANLEAAGVHYVLRRPGHIQAVAEWLAPIFTDEASMMQRLSWMVGLPLPPFRRVRKFAQHVLPRSWYLWGARRLGPSRVGH